MSWQAVFVFGSNLAGRHGAGAGADHGHKLKQGSDPLC